MDPFNVTHANLAAHIAHLSKGNMLWLLRPLILIIQTCKQLYAPWEGVGWRKMAGRHLKPGVQMESCCLTERKISSRERSTFFEAVSSYLLVKNYYFPKLQSKIQQILGGLTFNEYLILRIFLSDHTYKQLVSHIFIIPLIVMHLFLLFA